jgi:mono/diheme cytochrome c family protein
MIRPRSMAFALVTIALATAAFAVERTAKTAAPAKAKPDATASVIERGRKLAIFGGCVDCHTPGAWFGAPDFSRQLSGSELGWTGPWGTTYARNLTPDLETGLGYYNEKEIVLALRSGKRLDGKTMLPPMPWQNIATLSEADMHALVAYLQSLPPVEHKSPETLPPGQPPASGALSFPAPAAWDAPKTTGTPGK